MALTTALSVFLGFTLLSGFWGGSIAGYILGTYFTRLDQRKYKKMFDDLSIDYHDEYRKGSNIGIDVAVISCLVLMLSWAIAPQKNNNNVQKEKTTLNKQESKKKAIVHVPGVPIDNHGLRLKPKPFTGPSFIWPHATHHGRVRHGQNVTIIKEIKAGSYIGRNKLRCMTDEFLVETEGGTKGWVLSKFILKIDCS